MKRFRAKNIEESTGEEKVQRTLRRWKLDFSSFADLPGPGEKKVDLLSEDVIEERNRIRAESGVISEENNLGEDIQNLERIVEIKEDAVRRLEEFENPPEQEGSKS